MVRLQCAGSFVFKGDHVSLEIVEPLALEACSFAHLAWMSNQ